MKTKPITQIKIFILFVNVLLLLLLALSLYYNLRETRQRYITLARGSARSLFQAIVVTRRWNAQHGGVYVVVAGDVRPNPYLRDPRRDLSTREGLRLTKINPAFMTRMISGIMEEDRSVRFHITSLKPLNPSNSPDDWERKALERFEHGEKEQYIVTRGDGGVLRYMAPLMTEKSCLACHTVQGYREGQVRGGISVTIPFGVYRTLMGVSLKRQYLLHGVFFGVTLALTGLFGFILIRNVRRYEETLTEVKTLSGLLPICSRCKKIRNDEGFWERVDSYIESHSGAQFSHGLC